MILTTRIIKDHQKRHLGQNNKDRDNRQNINNISTSNI